MSAISRRAWLRAAALTAAGLALPAPLQACATPEQGCLRTSRLGLHDPDMQRLVRWTRAVRDADLARSEVPFGRAVVAVGEQAIGTPYEAFTLEAYLRAGGSPVRAEPLTLSLTRFDCVSLVEACIAVARVAQQDGAPTWDRFGHQIERVRYRGGQRAGYTSRLHYFSEWIHDNARRGGVRELGKELGGVADTRPLRFMTEHRDSYPALGNPEVFREIAAQERRLDAVPRWLIPTGRIPEVQHRIETGDVLAFATAIPGLDVTHSALAYRDAAGVLRVLHAPLSGGAVEVTRSTLPEYVARIRRSTGILVARPLRV